MMNHSDLPFNTNSLGTNPFFVQEISNLEIVDNRKILFEKLCKNKKVLHVGCTDYPFSEYENNLHSYLNTIGVEFLDGMDIDEDGIQEMKKYVSGDYYTNLKDIKKTYDIVLVPETIEHIPNIQIFLSELEAINTTHIFITAPCFFNEFKNKEFGFVNEKYYEIVHPDHKVWFTPYTLKNCITQYTEMAVESVFILENGHMVGVLATKTKKDN